MYLARELAYYKKEEHSIRQVNVTSKNRLDTLSMLKSVYFFIANTIKIESNQIIAIIFLLQKS